MQGNLTNAAAINELHQILDRIIAELASRGTYGTGKLTFDVADGIIQLTGVLGESTKRFRPPKRTKKT